MNIFTKHFFFSGEAKELEIEEAFLSSFEFCENKGQVTYAVRIQFLCQCPFGFVELSFLARPTDISNTAGDHVTVKFPAIALLLI